MCLWILTACLGVAVAPQPQYYGYYRYGSIVAGGVPPPIVLPTGVVPTAPTFATTLPPISSLPPTVVTPPGMTLPPLTPVPSSTVTGQQTFPTGPPPTLPPTTATTITTARPTLPTLTPVPPGSSTAFPLIDPRTSSPFRMGDIEPLTKFGGGDYEDVVIEVNLADSVSFPRDRRQITGCACYLIAQCNVTGNTDGSGLIDFRIVGGGPSTCATGYRFCCLPPTSGQTSCGSRLQGNVVYPTTAGQARYGDFPWMAVIMTTANQYIGGGVLIDTQNVLTTVHRISSYPNGSGIKIRLGEWDGSANYEQYPYRDFTIARVFAHESFNPNTLQNDVAVIRLTGSVPPGTPGIIPICLPTAGQSFDSQRCVVSGWGKDSFGINGQYQSILKVVDVAIIPSATCETTFRTTRLGTSFQLDRTSFMCAGGEANKDACTGDGGSGLVCETSPGRFTLAGLVAWGLGCATQGVPGAYVNVPNYIPWIQARQTMNI